MPPRATAVASASAATAPTPTQRDRYPRTVTKRSRVAWQNASFDNPRAKAEVSIRQCKRAIGDTFQSRIDQTEAFEVVIAAANLKRMPEFGRPSRIRTASTTDLAAAIASVPRGAPRPRDMGPGRNRRPSGRQD